ncbi:MAG: hypothetical protein Q8P20_09775, partial [bacterium]|nr:hypothetical protein [bacterium]
MGLSKYPTQLDDATSSPIATDLVTPVAAAIFNRVRAATLAAQAELGTNPSGVYGTVRARLDAISAAINTINATGIVHAIAHGQGGVDEITVQNLGSDSAAAGWLLAADGVGGLAFTTNLHAPSHSAGGSDEITVQDLGSALATDGYVLTADGFGALTFESTLHAPSHSAGGSDEITVQDLGSALATDGYVLTADGFGALTFESSLHASSHNAGGSDEITAQDLGSDSALDGYLMVADGLGGWDATLLLDKSVDPFANIQGIKIDPDFGSQDVITTGGIIANQIALGGKSLPGATFGIALPNSQGVVIDNAGGVGRDVLRMNGATDTIEIGQNTSTVQIHASGAGLLTLVGGVQRAQLTTAAHILSMAGRQWASTVVSPSITQLIDTGIASTGDTLTISAQQCSGGASTGGGLVLKPGDGTAASGSLKLQHGDTTTIVELTAAKTVLISGDTTVTGKVSASTYMAIGATPATTGDIRLPHQFTIYTRDSTGTNRILSSQDAVNNMYFGNGSATTQIGGGGAGGRVVVASAFVSLAVPLYFVSAVVAPTIYQATDTTIGVTGDTFSLHAQDVNSAGAASTGGNLLIRAGNGLGVADIAGNLQLSGGTDVGGGIGTVSITG